MRANECSLRQQMSERTTFGIASYTGSTAAIDIAGNWELDFVFIDAEHTALGVDAQMEKLLLAARASGVAALVRTRGTLEWDIRKSLELGAAGVIVPQVHSGEQMRTIIRAAKFPPVGRRGGDSTVRSARFAGPGFDWPSYTVEANRETLVIPMAESYEFFDNIDDILAVDGIDAVHFGPVDYALSRQLPVDYTMSHPEVWEKFELLVARCHARNIKVMVPCSPPTEESSRRLIAAGADMLIMGSDVNFINDGCRIAAALAKRAKVAA